jgi:hypothetical protein
MGAINTIMNELYRVRGEVLRRQNQRQTKFALYYGRLAEMEMALDPEVLTWQPAIRPGARFPQQVLGALLQADYDLPEYAVAIHVDGKPYTTLSLEPSPAPASSPGAITGMRKAEAPCSDCIDGWCQMNCGPRVG